MYRVKIQYGDNVITIHEPSSSRGDPHMPTCKIVEGTSNEIESCTFEIYPENPGYEYVHPRLTFISVIDLDTVVESQKFAGRVLTVTPEMKTDGTVYKTVVCESRKGYLCDSVQPHTEEKTYYGDSERTGLQEFIDLILANHNAQVEDYKKVYRGTVTVMPNSTGSVTKSLNYETTWEIITKKLIGSFGGEVQVYTSADGLLYLDYVTELGEVSDTEIRMGKNLTSIARERDPSDVITRLIPLGAEQYDDEGSSAGRLTIADVNNGVIYIDDADGIAAYGIVVGTVEWDDVTVASNLLEKAQDWLNAQTSPESIKLTALDLSRIGLESEQFARFNYYPVINEYIGLDAYLRVVKTTLDVVDPTEFTIEMGALNKSMAAALSETTGTSSRAATDTSALLAQLQSVINSLTVAKATIGYLENVYAEINTLVNGNLTSANIQSLTLTAENTIIENGLIKNAMIESVSADKLSAGDIYTNLVRIYGDESKLLSIVDNTIQISDTNAIVRVQIGEDASGDYNMYIWDASGNLMWNATGATAAGLNDGIIKDVAIADDAHINALKVDYTSLNEALTEQGVAISSTSIWMDDGEQTLGAAFNAITTTVGGLTETTEYNATQISAIQGQIEALISNTTIEVDGETVSLKDAYSATAQTVESMDAVIGNHTSLINSLTGDVESVTSRITAVELDLDGIKASVSAVESTADSLSERVATAETTLDGYGMSLTTLQSTVAGNTTTLESHTSSIAGLENSVALCVNYSDMKTYVSGQLVLYIEDKVAYLSANADVIKFKSDQISIDSTHFKLDLDGSTTMTNANVAGTLTLDGKTNYIKASNDIWLAPGGTVPGNDILYDRWVAAYEKQSGLNVVSEGTIVAATTNDLQIVALGDQALGFGSLDGKWGVYDYESGSWMIYRNSSTSSTTYIPGTISTTSVSATTITATTFTGSLSGTASVASKLGTATVGGAAKPIYLNAGTATACSSTVGGAAKPVYMSGGTITACSSTVGGTSVPVYMSAGSITECSMTDIAEVIAQSSAINELITTYMNNYADSFAGSYLPLSGGTLTGTVYAHSIYPETASYYLLGSSTYPWSAIYVKTAYFGGGVTYKVDSSGNARFAETTADRFLQSSSATTEDDTNVLYAPLKSYYANERAFEHVHPTSGYSVRFGVGSGGLNRGVYIPSTSHWLIARHTYYEDDEYKYITYIQGPLHYQPGNGTRHDGHMGEWLYTENSTASTTSGTYKAVLSKTLKAGTWLLIANAYFQGSSSGGYCCVNISTTSGATAYTGHNATFVQQDTAWCNLQVSTPVSHTSDTTYYVNAGQNSGSTVSVTGALYCIRLL